jgi:hypothetical protein
MGGAPLVLDIKFKLSCTCRLVVGCDSLDHHVPVGNISDSNFKDQELFLSTAMQFF